MTKPKSKRGGARPGAGRKATGRKPHPSLTLRVPPASLAAWRIASAGKLSRWMRKVCDEAAKS